MVPQPFIFPQTKNTTTTTEVESCGAGLNLIQMHLHLIQLLRICTLHIIQLLCTCISFVSCMCILNVPARQAWCVCVLFCFGHYDSYRMMVLVMVSEDETIVL